MARPAGTVIPTSMESPTAMVHLSNYEYAVGSKRIISCQSGGGDILRDIPRYIRMLEQGQLDTTPYLSKTFPLSEINDAFQAMRERSVITGVILNDA